MTTIGGHRVVLASASPYFHAMFNGNLNLNLLHWLFKPGVSMHEAHGPLVALQRCKCGQWLFLKQTELEILFVLERKMFKYGQIMCQIWHIFCIAAQIDLFTLNCDPRRLFPPNVVLRWIGFELETPGLNVGLILNDHQRT
jgi:hypothetical protein